MEVKSIKYQTEKHFFSKWSMAFLRMKTVANIRISFFIVKEFHTGCQKKLFDVGLNIEK